MGGRGVRTRVLVTVRLTVRVRLRVRGVNRGAPGR